MEDEEEEKEAEEEEEEEEEQEQEEYKNNVVLSKTSSMFPIINSIVIGRVSLSSITLIKIFLTFSNQALAVDHDSFMYEWDAF